MLMMLNIELPLRSILVINIIFAHDVIVILFEPPGHCNLMNVNTTEVTKYHNECTVEMDPTVHRGDTVPTLTK